MPTRQVVIGDVVEVIRQAEGLLNETEVAERYGISRPALSRYRDELTGYPGVRHDVVGQSHVYWWDADEAASTEENDGESVDDAVQPTEEEVNPRDDTPEASVAGIDDVDRLLMAIFVIGSGLAFASAAGMILAGLGVWPQVSPGIYWTRWIGYGGVFMAAVGVASFSGIYLRQVDSVRRDARRKATLLRRSVAGGLETAADGAIGGLDAGVARIKWLADLGGGRV